ncbi:MAG: DUF4932 domain-containing protein [Gemmatimonadaceae bacterium]
MLAAFVAFTLSAHTAAAQNVRVVDDQRAEVIAILFRIAGAPDFSDGNAQPYKRQVDSAFAPFKNHPVFVELNRLRKAYGIHLSDITTMAPQLTDAISFGERTPIDAPTSALAGSWHGAEARQFLALARDFAKVAGLADFLRRHKPVYDSATARAQRIIDANTHLEWFAKFFGETSKDLLVISPLLASGNGNYAAEYRGGGTHERYAYLAVPSADAAGFPVMQADLVATLIHELNHSYINHVLDSIRTQLQPAGAQIYPAVQSEMRRLAYSSPQTMFNESVVRAGVIRYLLANDGVAAARTETQLQRGLGFVWMDELVEVLGEYESQRAKYPTFSAFSPRLVAFYDSLAPRIIRVRESFEKNQPRIIKTSIANAANDVSPALRQLVLTFDKPVNTSIAFVGNLGADLPEFTGGTFDATRTVFTIGISLTPSRNYLIQFGSAFTSDDGYANQRLDLKFRTHP